MAVSDRSGHRQRVSYWKRLVGQLSRYDFVLAAIPLVFALALLTSVLAPLPLYVAVGAGAALSGILVVDVIYINPPVGPPSETE